MRRETKTILLSVFLGMLVWVLDGLVDYFSYYESTFPGVLIFDVPLLDLYIRSAIVIVFLLFGVIMSRVLARRRGVEESLLRRGRYLSCLADISAELLMFSDLSVALPRSLERMREVSGADRCYLFENHEGPSGELLTSQRFEVCAEGVEPQADDPLLQSFPLVERGFSRWVDEMTAGRAVSGRVADFPESERAVLEPQGIQWILALPLHVGGRWHGFIGFDVCRPGPMWTEQEVNLLRTAASAISSTMERVKTDAAIVRAKKEWERTFDAVPDLIAILDKSYRIVRLNKPLADRLGVRLQEAVGLTCYVAVHGTNDPPDFCPHTKLLADGNEHIAEIREERLGGDFIVSASPIRDAEGRLAGCVHVWRDITERKKAEEALSESEERYRSLFENSPISLWEEDFSEVKNYIDGLRKRGVREFRAHFDDHPEEVAEIASMVKIVDVNRATLELYRAGSEKEFIGGLDRVFAEESYDVFKEELIAIAGGETIFESEAVNQTFAGDRKNIFLRWSVAPGYEESLSKILVSIIDITERKKVEEALLESEEKYRKLVESASDAIFIADAETGIILDVNKKAEELLGQPAEDIVGMHQAELHPEEDSERYKEIFQDCARREKSFLKDLLVCRKDGSTVPVEISASVVDVGGKKIVQGIFRDVTERKRVEEQLRHAQKMEAVGTLAGGVAHDFNNILAGIMGYASLMMQGLEKSSPLVGDLEKIERLSRRAADLTQALLTFSRRGEIRLRPLRINRLVDEVLGVVGRTAGKRITIQAEPLPEVSNVLGDGGQLNQVIMNLCLNACEAMPEGGTLLVTAGDVRPGEVFYAAHPGLKRGEYVAIAVADTGVGMDPETRERIFEPFFTTKAEKSGTGLGLSIVNGIVVSHGGCIEVKSKQGRGSTFTVYLPATEEEVAEARQKPLGTLRGDETILVIDDEEGFRESARRWLEELGYTAIEAASGEEALRIVAERKGEIDLVLLDMVMPGIGGAETFRGIREILAGIPVVICTGYSIDEAASRLLENGAEDFLQKPFDLTKLAMKVRKVLDGR